MLLTNTEGAGVVAWAVVTAAMLAAWPMYIEELGSVAVKLAINRDAVV